MDLKFILEGTFDSHNYSICLCEPSHELEIGQLGATLSSTVVLAFSFVWDYGYAVTYRLTIFMHEIEMYYTTTDDLSRVESFITENEMQPKFHIKCFNR